MLQIKIRPLPQVNELVANPAFLNQTEGLRLGVYTGVSVSAKLMYLAFLASAVSIFAAVANRAELQSASDIYVATSAGIFVLLSLALVLFTRKIASARIHLVPLGSVFPAVSEATRSFPKKGWRWLVRRLNTSASANRAFDFDIAVRATEPNVHARLREYAERKSVIEYDDLDRGYEALTTAHLPAYRISRSFAKRQAKHGHEKMDLWPVVRLIVARVLYHRPEATKSIQKRTTADLAAKPEVKGAHYYLAFKLNVIPIAIWMLLISIALVAPSLSTDSISSKTIAAAISVLVFVWGLWTLIYNRSLVARWKQWLVESGERPLGNLPIFLYAPSNGVHYKWEELDKHDFKVFIDEYLMDTNTSFQLIVGFFMGTALTFSRVMA